MEQFLYCFANISKLWLGLRKVWEIPLTVFKEAIINVLSHRDYYEQGATTNIEMFDDRVERGHCAAKLGK
ncbi:MAG: hypothetical protein WCX48_12040 [Bacteroidales bacterium]